MCVFIRHRPPPSCSCFLLVDHRHPHQLHRTLNLLISTQASVAAMTSNQLPSHMLPYHMTSGYKGSAFGFGVSVIDDWEVTPSLPEGEVRESVCVSV
jgi:hypothetical protein